jgi:hypothetical protein
MGTETQKEPEESPPKLDAAEEWTYGDPLSPEATRPEAAPPPAPRPRSGIRRLLARVERMLGLRIGRS